MTAPTQDRLTVRLAAEPRDRYPWVSLAAAALVAVAGAMAAFGLPPIDLHGPMHWYGIMDPLCGGTRAARYTAQGNLAEAWRYNPLSILVVYGAGLAILRAAVGLLGRRWVTFTVCWTPGRRRWAIAVLIVLVALLEVRQQMRADLLMADTHTWV